MTEVTRWTVQLCPAGHLQAPPAPCFYCEVCGGRLGEPFEVVRATGARSSDPDTSKLAALQALPRSGSQRREVLDAISRSGHVGLTAREVERTTGIDRAGRRVSELRQGGHIMAIGTRKDEVTKAEGEVFVATPQTQTSNGTAVQAQAAGHVHVAGSADGPLDCPASG